MDPPKQQQQSTNSPPLLQPSSPQESSSEIQDSEFHTWFQEIFPGRQLPASFQPEQTSVPRKVADNFNEFVQNIIDIGSTSHWSI
ncbi:hypothetical protein P8452_47718 [Trifolium repens]|nr:hypothetical protein P8452_47718 [Trifolium repens]